MNRSASFLKSRLRHQRGSAGVAALACMVVILIYVAALMNLASGALTIGARARSQAQLRALTDGGLEYGYNAFAWGDWSSSSQNYVYGTILPEAFSNVALGPGTFSVTISDNSATLANTFKVVCKGTIGKTSLTETRIYPQPWDDPPYYSNFYSNNQLMFSGASTVVNGRLRLTDGGVNEKTTVFNCSPVRISAFHIQFTFQLVDYILQSTSAGQIGADGFTFCIQNSFPYIPTYVGMDGGGLGYGPTLPGGSAGIPNSVAIKFDLWDDNGEGYNSTGFYVSGASPTTPSTNLTPSGVDLHSGNIMQVNLVYSGTTLTVTLKDTVTGKTATQSYSKTFSTYTGTNEAYMGFTASTSSATAVQDILSWTYTSP